MRLLREMALPLFWGCDVTPPLTLGLSRFCGTHAHTLDIRKPKLSKSGSKGQHQRSQALMGNLRKNGGREERDGRRREKTRKMG